jgi:hypothetical protein
MADLHGSSDDNGKVAERLGRSAQRKRRGGYTSANGEAQSEYLNPEEKMQLEKISSFFELTVTVGWVRQGSSTAGHLVALPGGFGSRAVLRDGRVVGVLVRLGARRCSLTSEERKRSVGGGVLARCSERGAG